MASLMRLFGAKAIKPEAKADSPTMSNTVHLAPSFLTSFFRHITCSLEGVPDKQRSSDVALNTVVDEQFSFRVRSGCEPDAAANGWRASHLCGMSTLILADERLLTSILFSNPVSQLLFKIVNARLGTLTVRLPYQNLDSADRLKCLQARANALSFHYRPSNVQNSLALLPPSTR